MNCKECQGGKAVVPYIVHEAIVERLTQTKNKLFLIIIIFIIAMVVNNIAWILCMSSNCENFATTCTELTEDSADERHVPE